MIKHLCDLKAADKIIYGNKACNLALLSSHLLVPDGFALPTEFYKSFLFHNGFSFTDDELLGKNREIRERIHKSVFPAELKDEIIDGIKPLERLDKSTAYAVRSSSICEDSSNYSMAGLFDSFIGLSSIDEITEAIKGCYISLYSDRVLDYFDNYSLDFSNLKMGVIVQRYIQGVMSGVIFTADTKEQDSSRIVISYTEGGCHNFVNGKLPSAYLTIDKETGNIIESNEKIPLSERLRNKLLNAALQTENILGVSADIEWTYDGRQVYILQARPITTLKNRSVSFELSPLDTRYHWFLADSKPMLPLMQSFYQEYFSASGDGIVTTGYTSRYVIHKIINGYLYMRNGTLDNEKKIQENWNKHLKMLTAQDKNIFVDEVLPTLQQLISKMKCFDKKEFNAAEIEDYVKITLEYNKAAIRGHWLAIFGEKYLNEFKEFVYNTIGDIDAEDFYDLVYRKTLKTKERELLFHMADFIKNDDEQFSVINSSDYSSIRYGRLKHTKYWYTLEPVFQKYLDQYGMEFAGEKRNPANTLCEKPQYIIEKIIPLLSQNSGVFYQSIIDIQKNQLKLLQQIQSQLTDDQYKDFKSKLILAQKSFITIDDHHYYCEDIPWGCVKTALNQAGNHLAYHGMINNPDDIYYLSFGELFAILEGRIDCPELEKRKINFKHQKTLFAPGCLGASPTACENKTDVCNELDNDCLLKGFSSLKRIVKGKILVGPAIPSLVKEDCILLVQNGHMGELFSVIGKIKGLIVTGGSPFDHMGIITREMGIPALYYVDQADTKLKTGDIVTLNGVDGYVKLEYRSYN